MLITDDVWIKEVKEKALEAGFEESTISVVNSWCKEIFCLGCDLLNVSFHSYDSKNNDIRISARMTDGNLEVSLQIDILKCTNSPKIQVTLTRHINDESWSYNTQMNPYLTHFKLFARRSGMFDISL